MTKHVTVQLQPARGESISQELAILALVGAVNLVPGTYTVDNAPLVAAALDAAPADGPAVPEVVEPPLSEQLVEQWVAEVWHEGTPVRVAASDLYLAAKAAEWGARWGRPAPAPAGEVGEVARWLRSTGEGQPLLSDEGYARLTRAADLLERQAAPVPVAVSERLPGPEDCDEEGRCWLLTVEDEYPQWRLHSIEGSQPGGDTMIWVPVDSSPGVMVDCFYTSHWLPAHALPIPEQGDH